METKNINWTKPIDEWTEADWIERIEFDEKHPMANYRYMNPFAPHYLLSHKIWKSKQSETKTSSKNGKQLNKSKKEKS